MRNIFEMAKDNKDSTSLNMNRPSYSDSDDPSFDGVRATDDPAVSEGLINIVVVPYWISRIVKRNKADYIALADFDQMRQWCTDSELGSLLALQDFPVSANLEVDKLLSDRSDYLVSRWVNAENTKLISDIRDLGLSERQFTLNRLNETVDTSLMDVTENSLYEEGLGERPEHGFKIINGSEFIVVIVFDNFFASLKNKTFLSQFYTQLVRTLYQKASPSLVARMEPWRTLFKNYLNVIRSPI